MDSIRFSKEVQERLRLAREAQRNRSLDDVRREVVQQRREAEKLSLRQILRRGAGA